MPDFFRFKLFSYENILVPLARPGAAGGQVSADISFTEMCSGSEAGTYLRLIDFVYHSTLGLRVIRKKKDNIISEIFLIREFG